MGLRQVLVTFVNPVDQTGLIDVELIVDAGSILTWVKSPRLEEIGVRPRREKEFRTIEGRVIRRSTGPAVIRYDGAEADIEVVFGKEEDAEVLGVTALEGLGYQVDPVTKELRRSALLALLLIR